MKTCLCVLYLCVCSCFFTAPVAAVDITLLVASDPHFTGTAPSTNVQSCIYRMNTISGAAYPSGIGGTVATPAAAILCGDLCTGGTLFHSCTDDEYRQQWSGFNYYFPKDGDTAATRLHYPTYAAPGNHDYYRRLGTAILDPSPSFVVAQELMARYGSGTGGVQEGNVCYSFDLEGVHFVCLGRYADNQVLSWLDTDLDPLPRETPVVVFLHYALDDSGVWYTSAEREALAAKLVGHRVVCLLHGHTHDSHYYTWHGAPVFDDGATNEDADFGVLRITDSRTIYTQRQVSSGGDYWKWSAQYCTITGHARTGSGPLAGVTLSASNSGGTVSTGTDGYYSLSVPVGWSGTVTPSKAGIVFSTAPRSYASIQSSIADQDYISDWVLPVPGTASSPAYSNTSPVNITYSGASDDYGLAGVELWYRKGATGSWAHSGLLSPGESGSFAFVPYGDDVYYFDLVAVDLAGNRSAPASGEGDCHTIYDTTPPLISSVSVSPPMVPRGNEVSLVVDATDSFGVSRVAANGIELVNTSGSIWCGVIPAEASLGQHPVTVLVTDAAGNSTTDSAQSYKTARLFTIANRDLVNSLPEGSASTYLFSAFGRVTRIDADTFELSDGSQTTIQVSYPSHGLQTGDYAVARGIWSPTSSPPTLNAASVTRVQ